VGPYLTLPTTFSNRRLISWRRAISVGVICFTVSPAAQPSRWRREGVELAELVVVDVSHHGGSARPREEALLEEAVIASRAGVRLTPKRWTTSRSLS
jgi:hypothetical protein